MMSDARGMPLGLQYIYTSLACGRFARGIAAHSCADGGAIVDIWTRDPRRLDHDEPETFVHTAVRLTDGRFLDAEGVRGFEDLCRDFGMKYVLSDVRPAKHPEPDTDSKHGILLRRLADLLGWQDGAPSADDIDTATGLWKTARREFDRMGGMNGKAETMLSKCIAKARREARTAVIADPSLSAPAR